MKGISPEKLRYDQDTPLMTTADETVSMRSVLTFCLRAPDQMAVFLFSRQADIR